MFIKTTFNSDLNHILNCVNKCDFGTKCFAKVEHFVLRLIKGVFGGISYIPAFCKELKMMAEYDSDGVNVGAAVRLWKHLSMHAFTHDFTCVSGGIRYECTLIH